LIGLLWIWAADEWQYKYYGGSTVVFYCMNITKDLLLFFIECICDEWLYEYYEGSTVVLYRMKLSWMVVWVLQKIYRCIILNINYHGWLYEYYEGSIVVLYWILIVMDGWMSNAKGVLLCYSMLNCYGMFCLCITKDLLSCLLNIKLLRNAYMSITKGLLLCYGECQVVINHLNEQFKRYYHVVVSS